MTPIRLSTGHRSSPALSPGGALMLAFDSAEELQADWFEGKRRVGLTAGAAVTVTGVGLYQIRPRALASGQ